MTAYVEAEVDENDQISSDENESGLDEYEHDSDSSEKEDAEDVCTLKHFNHI